MTVAMMAATVRTTPERPPSSERNSENHRVRITRGVPSRRTKLMTVPAMKQAYMTLDPILSRFRMVSTSEGRAILAPASSSLTRIWTGLNQ